MRFGDEKVLKDVINDFLESKNLKGKLAESKIITNWENVVGALIAKNTRKMYIHEGKLFLYVDSAPLRQELNFSKSKIIELVNKEAGFELIEDVIMR